VIEVKPNDDDHTQAMLFAGGVALAYLQDYNKEVTIEDLDHSIRHELGELGHTDHTTADWAQTYVEFVSHLIVRERNNGSKYPIEEYTKMCGALMSIGYAHVMNVCNAPDVTVVPPMSANFGVPTEWVAETVDDAADEIWKVED
jgi:hypothetical protein